MKVLAVFDWQDYLQHLRLICWESANPNIAALGASQFDQQLWSSIDNLVPSIGLDHLAFTEETFSLHNQCIKLILCGSPCTALIKLLTLVQDSSMERKPELFPYAKVHNIFPKTKKMQKFHSCTFFIKALAFAAKGVSGLSASSFSRMLMALSVWSSLTYAKARFQAMSLA